MRPNNCTLCEGYCCLAQARLLVMLYRNPYLVITIALADQPALPFVPSVATAHGEQSIERLLPSRWGGMDRTFAANVDILQVLQSRTVRGVVIPYRQLEQESPKC